MLAADMSFEIRAEESATSPAWRALRVKTWGTEPYWRARIRGYLNGEYSPQQAQAERVTFVALDGDGVVGLVAGHRTKRFGCDGELEWIDVAKEYRGRGIAEGLMTAMIRRFVEQGALRVCVNVSPENIQACRLYPRYVAVPVNLHGMIWKDVGRSLNKLADDT